MKLWMAPAGLHIEPAIPSDAHALAKMHAGAFFRPWPEMELANYIAAPDRTPVYIACDAARRIAGFMILRLAANEAELLTIIVEGKKRSRGIGAALLRAGFDDLLMSAVTTMFLEVDEANPPAIKLYRNFGFEQVGKRPGYYQSEKGAPATALIMRCDLN
ncbi:hypothetical protein MNBD_ALPHA12-1965 [hydrothermal vent metagenome]|uniref:N-acetyltransferase domain-containing protein n=1 Tax=hydrothermal vent metagenome TaxID=652676 RepID=A0A3B0U674_9ZZZZ